MRWVGALHATKLSFCSPSIHTVRLLWIFFLSLKISYLRILCIIFATIGNSINWHETILRKSGVNSAIFHTKYVKIGAVNSMQRSKHFGHSVPFLLRSMHPLYFLKCAKNAIENNCFKIQNATRSYSTRLWMMIFSIVFWHLTKIMLNKCIILIKLFM